MQHNHIYIYNNTIIYIYIIHLYTFIYYYNGWEWKKSSQSSPNDSLWVSPTMPHLKSQLLCTLPETTKGVWWEHRETIPLKWMHFHGHGMPWPCFSVKSGMAPYRNLTKSFSIHNQSKKTTIGLTTIMKDLTSSEVSSDERPVIWGSTLW